MIPILKIVAARLTAACSALALSCAATASPSPEASGCKLIRTAAELQAIGPNATGSFCLASNIDAGSIANFVPLGLTGGHFFGNGHIIRNLRITSDGPSAALFAQVEDATIQDVSLVNAKVVVVSAGAIGAGVAGKVVDTTGSATRISRVRVHGRIICKANCIAGGIAGYIAGGAVLLTDSSSSAAIEGPAGNISEAYVGGAVGVAQVLAVIRNVHATGNVICAAAKCIAGGLAGYSIGTVDSSGASGNVTITGDGSAGGLIGWVGSPAAVVRRTYASGAVINTDATAGDAGGLIGRLAFGTVTESYSVGPVLGGALRGGLIGTIGTASINSSFWDTATSGQSSTGGGIGLTTGELRQELPVGFGFSWALTKGRSYPFLDDALIDFASQLATLVRFNRVFTFVPIGQLERSEYKRNPKHKTAASRAAVYTMIARAVGNTRAVATLRHARIDTYWNDAAQIVALKPPLTEHIKPAALVPLAANAELTDANVIGKLNAQQLVILRGSYSKPGGGTGKHWMLATLYTATPAGAVNAVVANDPWTGRQVLIDPITKRVATPGGFPLKNFKIDAYQPVKLLDPQ